MGKKLKELMESEKAYRAVQEFRAIPGTSAAEPYRLLPRVVPEPSAPTAVVSVSLSLCLFNQLLILEDFQIY